MRSRTDPRTASDVVKQARNALDGKVSSVGEVVDALGVASYTPLLMVPSLALASPLSGVPGFSSVCGLLIAAVSLQQILERPSLWLPRWMRRATISTDHARGAMQWLTRPARWLDKFTRRRLHGLVTPPLARLPQGICLIFGMMMPLLELVPFTSSILGGIIAVIATGMFMGDGLLVLIGMMLATGVTGGLVSLL
ncbi:exopolysaccharide biosynthesis protein [uncultured Roseovarius sp.]|uniref:exopolysaccharide biosynthesis protein n=1 Tax=uncultured Roseovarius sp. TaxID=293344 RepID=UPI00261FCC33|nr:exopolysaccharide biosynthesis protein [uncultured Roseovarius sp.]